MCEQPPYSILVRGIEATSCRPARRYGMGVIPWSPLAGGWLSGKWRKGGDTSPNSRATALPPRYDLTPGNQLKLDAVRRWAQLADDAGIPLVQLAVAGCSNHPRSLPPSSDRAPWTS